MAKEQGQPFVSAHNISQTNRKNNEVGVGRFRIYLEFTPQWVCSLSQLIELL